MDTLFVADIHHPFSSVFPTELSFPGTSNAEGRNCGAPWMVALGGAYVHHPLVRVRAAELRLLRAIHSERGQLFANQAQASFGTYAGHCNQGVLGEELYLAVAGNAVSWRCRAIVTSPTCANDK